MDISQIEANAICNKFLVDSRRDQNRWEMRRRVTWDLDEGKTVEVVTRDGTFTGKEWLAREWFDERIEYALLARDLKALRKPEED